MITHKRLKELLHYSPKNGNFYWLKRNSYSVHLGDIAGCKWLKLRIAIRLDGHLYLAHRLAWFYMTGDWPKQMIDHKNGNPLDNRWNNLRQATPTQNQANRRISKVNKTGFKGVQTIPGSPKFAARIKNGKKNIHLGMFDTPEAAHRAYLVAAAKLHSEFANGG